MRDLTQLRSRQRNPGVELLDTVEGAQSSDPPPLPDFFSKGMGKKTARERLLDSTE